MDAYKLPDGNLLVPVPAYVEGNEVQGDGMRVVKPGSKLYKAYIEYAIDPDEFIINTEVTVNGQP